MNQRSIDPQQDKELVEAIQIGTVYYHNDSAIKSSTILGNNIKLYIHQSSRANTLEAIDLIDHSTVWQVNIVEIRRVD